MTTSLKPRFGIFGGTFDPIHHGHLLIASELKFRLSLERVLFLPAGRPPHKTDREISSDQHRVAMLELGIAGNPDFEISYVDVERNGLSYTSDSLALLQSANPEHQLYFLMGQDSLRDLPNWHEPGQIARQAIFGVALRPGVHVDVDHILEVVPEAIGRIEMVQVPLIQIASSDIRRRVRTGQPIAYHVPLKVEDYIRHHRLYYSAPGAD
jgi:nicotinate-nucleotide adenylyltransferase